jgi:geranylgeranyl diphosphate synthase type I
VSFSATSDIKEIRTEINQVLAEFIRRENKNLAKIGPELNPVGDALEKFLLDSGKRLRPLFAYVGLIGGAAQPTKELVSAVASLELIHVCALIHDDVMDDSDIRRGAPSIHKSFEKMHIDNHLVGSAAQFGVASAILIGDLALIWSAQMLHNSGISIQDLIRALPIYDEMRVELMAGQYLDVYEQSLGTQSIERSLKVARYKSGKYTIERPLHFGAALADAPSELMQIYSNYGLPLGEAFQLRDDLLGVFGTPNETGKPAGDDLREGKRTALLAIAQEKANSSQSAQLKKHIGDPDLTPAVISDLQQVIIDTGAASHIETMIEELTNTSLEALEHDGISPNGKRLLTDLAVLATNRKI